MTPRPPISTLFPYTTLFRSAIRCEEHRSVADLLRSTPALEREVLLHLFDPLRVEHTLFRELEEHPRLYHAEDRKSTRLNSSHSQISYAVFCLKKKKKKPTKN